MVGGRGSLSLSLSLCFDYKLEGKECLPIALCEVDSRREAVTVF